MRLLIVTPTFWGINNQYGGAERFVRDISIALLKTKRFSSIRVVTFSPDAEDLIYEQDVPVEIHRTQYIDSNLSNPIVTIKSLLRSDYDIVYLHQFNTWMTFYFTIWSKIIGKKILLTDHNGGGRCFNRKLKINTFINSFYSTSRMTYQEMDLAFKKVKIVWGGVDTNLFRVLDDITISKDLIFVGRLKDIKGLKEICQTLEKVSSKGVFSIAFTTPQSDEEFANLAMLKEFSLKNSNWKIELHQNLNQNQLVHLYNQHRWCILPSIFQKFGKESLGLVVLEALSCGTNAICSEYCGIADLAKDLGKSFFKVCTDWNQFLSVDYKFSIPKNEVRSYAIEHFSWDRVAHEIVEDLEVN